MEAANPRITNPNFIYVGERVHVPGRDAKTSAPVATHTSSTTSTTSNTSNTSTDPASTASSGGAPSSFQQCVAWRESSNTPTDPDGLYGILPSTWASLGYSGTAGEASVAVQNQAFQKLYAEDGTAPWAPYDGC